MTARREWEGRGVVVSGGSRGIGRACAIAFARQGADVVIQYRSDRRAAEGVVRDVRGLGLRGWAVEGDAAEDDDARELVREAQEAMGSIHTVVANAGVDGSGPIESTSPLSFRRTLEVDLFGPFALIKAARIPLGAAEGSAVAVASISGLLASPESIDYSAAKAGLIGMVRSLAVALAPHVRVNAVAPGWIRTDMTRSWWNDDRLSREALREIPAGRWGTPEDVAEAVVFLAGSGARFITGHTLVVDGGEQHVWSAAWPPDE